MILVRTSPSIERSEQDDTVSSDKEGVPLSQDATSNSDIRNSDHHTIKDKIANLPMRLCFVQLHAVCLAIV
jgi:hypothetical protein